MGLRTVISFNVLTLLQVALWGYLLEWASWLRLRFSFGLFSLCTSWHWSLALIVNELPTSVKCYSGSKEIHKIATHVNEHRNICCI